jgi:myo-inositol 2-dehydrogenase / D-chiro-inositol 1-dehydrogenase
MNRSHHLENHTMRFAVIGCGWITGAIHAPALAFYLREHPEMVPAACCDIDPVRAETVREKFGFLRAWSDVEAMLAVEPLDAVCLNVPPALTCELGCQVLRRGIPLLSEKPPGLTSDELERLITAAHEGGAAHMVAFNRRWMPLTLELRSRLGNRQVEHVQYTLSRVARRDPDFSTTAVHAVDAVSFLAGSAYRRVEIRWREMPEEGGGVADFSLYGEMESGAQVEIAVTPLAGVSVERALVSARGWSVDLHCPTGADGGGKLELYHEGQLEAALDGKQLAGGDEDWRLGGFYNEDAAFFDSLSAGRKPPDGLETARQVVAIMQAIRERRSQVVFTWQWR